MSFARKPFFEASYWGSLKSNQLFSQGWLLLEDLVVLHENVISSRSCSPISGRHSFPTVVMKVHPALWIVAFENNLVAWVERLRINLILWVVGL